ncbi:uncharacterized protein LOC129981161 [Argiope bruennichi]|uniref:uncharacterized protein LOC129981161 n=1 Tax=Argiope bruennichi TaxID=94029 RepID=UPI0024945215|nr:uncharacterized protein LOC129981161 [Argiope bruennichi]XP_055947848.1 uncharacterized protein LOC129981161 [Argiope bruennichi]XP_055947851.1 uncharacterized protein LOC129981161 [Argiope bruennichi]
MSIKSVFKKDNSKCDGHESSDFPKMSEHLTDSNILQSKKTYGRNKNYASLSVYSESFSAFVEELCTEENSAFATSITSSSYSKNKDQEDVNSEFCLFNDEDTDYYISSSNDWISSPNLETASSHSNYQRTRKNQKDRLNNKLYNSEKTFKLPSHEENSNSEADDKEFKSASDFLNLDQATISLKQSSLLSHNNHAGIDVISSDDPVDVLPQKSSTTSTMQVAKPSGLVFGKGLFFENPLINTSIFSIVDLVKRFSVNNAKNNPSSKKNNEGCELASIKKKSVANRAASSKRNSFDTKTLNSTVSVKKSRKSVIFKNNEINLGNLDVKKNNAKTPRSIPKRNVRSFDKVEGNVDISYARNTDTPKKSSAKTFSEAVQEGNIKRSVKAEVKSSITHITSDFHLVGNGTTGKMQSDCDEKQIEKLPFVHSHEQKENAVQSQFFNIPIISAPISQETSPPFIWSSNDNQAVSFGNIEDLAIPGPSTLSNNHSSMESNECNTDIEPVNGSCVLIKKTTTTTTLLENPICHKQEKRPGTLAYLGVTAEQRASDYFQKTENMCILRKQEMADEIFSRHPALRDVTVSEFCSSPRITNTFFDYLDQSVGFPPNYHDVSKGYDFPENFETENLLSVLKDFVHSIIYYLIPKDGPKPLYIPYSRIVNAAVHKMSATEQAIVTLVFRKNFPLDNPFVKLDDMLSKLDFAAMLVIFYEYKRRQIISNLKN